MFVYGERSKLVLESLAPDLQVLCTELLKFRDVALLEGHRSSARQARLLRDKKTKVGPGKSKHNRFPSLAVDMIPYPFQERDWEDRDKFHLFAGFVLGVAAKLLSEGKMERPLRWGGDWDKDWETSDNEFDDFPHYELV